MEAGDILNTLPWFDPWHIVGLLELQEEGSLSTEPSVKPELGVVQNK